MDRDALELAYNQACVLNRRLPDQYQSWTSDQDIKEAIALRPTVKIMGLAADGQLYYADGYGDFEKLSFATAVDRLGTDEMTATLQNELGWLSMVFIDRGVDFAAILSSYSLAPISQEEG